MKRKMKRNVCYIRLESIFISFVIVVVVIVLNNNFHPLIFFVSYVLTYIHTYIRLAKVGFFFLAY